MDSISTEQIAHFQRRLAETIAWCALQDWAANPAEGLRTAALRPSEQARVELTFFNYDELSKKTPPQRQQIVEQLAMKRTALLQALDLPPLQLIRPLTGGRLLALDPDGNTTDGAAWEATQGFIDGCNIPAWDTWISYVTDDPVSNPPWYPFDSYLLTWVPQPLVKVVKAGIDCNSDVCLLWATDLDTPFIRQLRQDGLLS